MDKHGFKSTVANICEASLFYSYSMVTDFTSSKLLKTGVDLPVNDQLKGSLATYLSVVFYYIVWTRLFNEDIILKNTPFI